MPVNGVRRDLRLDRSYDDFFGLRRTQIGTYGLRSTKNVQSGSHATVLTMSRDKLSCVTCQLSQRVLGFSQWQRYSSLVSRNGLQHSSRGNGWKGR